MSQQERRPDPRPDCVQGRGGWDALTRALVRRAARTAPNALAARLEEEWLADLSERPLGLSRLGFALGCFWASVAIGRDPLSVPVASVAKANVTIVQPQVRLLSPRAATFGLVLSLHVAAFYGLMMTGLPSKLFKRADPPALQPHMIDLPQPKILPPRPTTDWRFTKIEMPPIDPPVRKEPEVLTDVIVRDPVPPEPAAPSTVSSHPHEAVHLQGGPGDGFPHPDEYYPDAARRLEEQGTATVQVCVDPAGRLTSDPVPMQSSGSSRLDAGAIRLAKAGSGHYRPSTADGRPVSDCYPLRIRFQLKN